MIAIRGAGSTIVTALVKLIDGADQIAIVARHEPITLDADRYFYCQGLLRSKPITAQTNEEIAETFMVSAGLVIQECERIIEANDRARIVLMGSESSSTGSFDSAYAASKRALHGFCETKRLRTPDQQLVCVSPGIIRDSGMTERRLDTDRLEERRARHPKRRFLEAVEVARMVYHLFYIDAGYVSGTVVRMHGGEHF